MNKCKCKITYGFTWEDLYSWARIVYSPLKPHWNCNLDLKPIGSHWSLLYGEKSWNIYLKNINFISTEERKSRTSWMISKMSKIFISTFLCLKWNNPLILVFHALFCETCGSRWYHILICILMTSLRQVCVQTSFGTSDLFYSMNCHTVLQLNWTPNKAVHTLYFLLSCINGKNDPLILR